jgi:putative DNA primase/helicase
MEPAGQKNRALQNFESFLKSRYPEVVLIACHPDTKGPRYSYANGVWTWAKWDALGLDSVDGGPPTNVIAALLPKNSIVVVDCDSMEATEKFCKMFPDVVRHTAVETTRRGIHVWFAPSEHSADLHTTTNRPLNIDVKGGSKSSSTPSACVVAPSPHKEWVPGFEPWTIGLKPMPQEVAEWLRANVYRHNDDSYSGWMKDLACPDSHPGSDEIDFGKVEDIVMHLGEECYGAHSYELWMAVIFAVMNLARRCDCIERASDLLHKFSQQGISFDANVLDMKIRELSYSTRDGYGFAKLKRLLRETNAEYFDTLFPPMEAGVDFTEYMFDDTAAPADGGAVSSATELSDAVKKLVKQAVMTGSHYDIAMACVDIFKDRIVCVDSRRGTYYTCLNSRGRWVLDEGDKVRIALSEVASPIWRRHSEALLQLAEVQDNPDEEAKLRKQAAGAYDIAMSLLNATAKDKILREFKALVFDCDFMNKLDSNPYLLAFENGVMDMQTGEFRDIRPSDYVTMSTGYDYVQEIDKDIREFLNGFLSDTLDIFEEDDDGSLSVDESKKLFALDFVASHLIGVNSQEQLVLLVGSGRNGKGVLTSLISLALGQGDRGYSYEPSVGILQKHANNPSAPNPELRKAKGKRILNVSEPDEDTPFNIAKIKGFSGNDAIQARNLNEAPIEFVPGFGITIQLNHLPPMSSFGKSVRSRFNFVTFERTFCLEPKHINERRLDPGLKVCIKQNVVYRQQFMLMLMERFFQQGMQKPRYVLKAPACVIDDNTEVFQEKDPVGAWLDTLKVGKDNVVHLDDAYEAYVSWLDKKNENSEWATSAIDIKAFKLAMQGHNFYVKGHTFRVKGCAKRVTYRGFRGITLS